MAPATSVTNKSGKAVATLELSQSAANYNANPNEQTLRAHARAMVAALISSGDYNPALYGAN